MLTLVLANPKRIFFSSSRHAELFFCNSVSGLADGDYFESNLLLYKQQCLSNGDRRHGDEFYNFFKRGRRIILWRDSASVSI